MVKVTPFPFVATTFTLLYNMKRNDCPCFQTRVPVWYRTGRNPVHAS